MYERRAADEAPPAGTPGRAAAPGTGETGVIGGRATTRAERQAVDVVRRREERRQGITPIPPLPEEGRRGSRGLVIGLVSFVVVALVLLGVWSFQGPDTQESASTAPATTSTAASATTTAAPPPAPVTTPAGPTGPVFAPVTVLNATTVNGLAGDIGTVLADGGWEIREEGSYGEQDVAVTTVFYTAGDAQQEQAAATLQAQFPDIQGGPSERFFEVEGVPDPGLVVIATGNWQP
ncbi:LytR C-terminal domain-containing protein [Klenkia terrae]|uniref:LytR C-terminal domain-containing protein n=1 Tax=Klenkia terrae TaxID=1052259 RepID=UPI001CD917BB|nr:LytR C-terminal domain-containing protein [Klenkia terrae]